MGYSAYGLDEVKKSNDDGKKGTKWCLWCNTNLCEKVFSLCFQNWSICSECVCTAFNPDNIHRWQDNVECYKCRQKDVRGYRHHEDNQGMEIHICASCIKWADAVLNNKKIEMSTQEALPFGYSDEELIEFKNNIEEKLEKANKELEYLQDLLQKDDPDNKFEKKQLEQMRERQLTFVNNLHQALQRIENKTYGICRVTGKLIDKPRLMAVPHATLCLEAKLALNKQPEQPASQPKPKKERKPRAVKNQPATVKHSDDDLRDFKTLISNKLEEAEGELKYLQYVLADRNKGIKVEDYEDMPPAEVEALIDRKKAYIAELINALNRIKNKTFGINEATGELIPKEVLLRLPIIKRLIPTPAHPSAVIENNVAETPVRKCRICGCTDNDCRQCIEKTGRPCHWIDTDLCSACEEEAMKEVEDAEADNKTEIINQNSENPKPEIQTSDINSNDNDMNFFQQLAQAAAQNVDVTMRIMQKDNKLTLNIMPGSKSVTIKPILVTGTAAELDAEFFKTIAPGINDIKGIVTNIESVKKDLEAQKNKKPDAPAPAKAKTPKKKAASKKEQKTADTPDVKALVGTNVTPAEETATSEENSNEEPATD